MPDPPGPFEPEARELVERLRPRLARTCREHGLSAEETEEVVYEAVAFLLHRWHGIREREGWLLGVVDEICAARVAAAAQSEDGAEEEAANQAKDEDGENPETAGPEEPS
ncbi:MAG: hypothetical protein ACLF0P_13675 [Thermoanaerobaculia bacterium]